jgi:putative flippase GtrA
MQSNKLAVRAGRFAVSGMIVTGLHVIIAAGYIHLIRPDPPLANALAFAVATLCSYALNTLWSFSSTPDGGNFRRFALVSLFGCILAATVSGIAEQCGYHFWVGIAFVVLTVPPMTFLLHSCWTYR